MTGHASPQPIVTTMSAHRASSSVRRRGSLPRRSTPTSRITFTTFGWMCVAGSVPADPAWCFPPASLSNRAWLICERPALCRQTKRTCATRALQLTRQGDLPAKHPAADQVDGEHQDDEHERGAPRLVLQRAVRQKRVLEH